MQKLNWQKIIILSAVLIVALSVFYYLVILIPKQDAEQQAQQAKAQEQQASQKCAGVGATFYQNLQQTENLQYISLGESGDFDSPVYYYNSKLNACLVSFIETLDLVPGATSDSTYIYNADTNTLVLGKDKDMDNSSNNLTVHYVYYLGEPNNSCGAGEYCTKNITETEYNQQYNQLMGQ
jgi:lipopolysaccharide export LptBFGC system permease protein LptF